MDHRQEATKAHKCVSYWITCKCASSVNNADALQNNPTTVLHLKAHQSLYEFDQNDHEVHQNASSFSVFIRKFSAGATKAHMLTGPGASSVNNADALP